VNFVGHIAAALETGHEHDRVRYLVGAALPDFAAMARIRLGPASDAALASGVALHHAADTVFHADSWFLDLERELREELSLEGLPAGAARACAHVGPELLLDGVVIEQLEVRLAVGEVYEQLAQPPREIVEIVAGGERVRWRSELTAITARLDPAGYRNANVVARRLHAITSRRSRLSFDGSLIAVVAHRMRAIRPYVEATAAGVVERVAARIAPGTRH
jgi:hypothetical protein